MCITVDNNNTEGNNNVVLEMIVNRKNIRAIFNTQSEKDDFLNTLKPLLLQHLQPDLSPPTITIETVNNGDNNSRKGSTHTIDITPPSSLTTATSTSSSASASRKVKCFVNKGTSSQRIRKIDLENIKSLTDLSLTMRKEFEWGDDITFSYMYVDKDGDEIEYSSSLSIEDILHEATSFIITSVTKKEV